MQWIKIDVFNIDIVFCKNIKEYNKLIKMKKIVNYPKFESRGLTIQFDNENDKMEMITIIVDETLEKYNFIDTLVHECSHAISMIMNFFNISDDEFRSYYLGFITKEIYKNISNDKCRTI